MIFTINKNTNFKHRKITVSNPQLFMSKPLAFMRTENLVNKKLSEFKTKKIKIFADFEN